MQVDVVDTEGKKVGALEVADAVFGARVKEHLLWEVVKAQQAAWNELDGAATVAVRYVPGDPDNNRLASGEVDSEPASPQMMEFVSVGVGIMALFFIGIGVVQWAGRDVDLDSKTGRISIKRFGTGR